jgi:hypothetical protein
LLKEIGLEPERLEMFNMSAAMAGFFASTAQQMSDRIAALGASPLKAGNGKADADEEQAADAADGVGAKD